MNPNEWRRCDPYRIIGSIVLFIFFIYAILRLNEHKEHLLKMNVEQQKETREMNKSLNLAQAMVVAELAGQKLSNANKFAELQQQNDLQEKVVKMEVYQKEQQQNINDLQKTVETLREAKQGIGLMPQNRWDSAACHDELVLIEPERLIVHVTGKHWDHRSIFAEWPIPNNDSGIVYYEVKVLAREGYVFIGLATKQMPLNRTVGDYDGTYAYASWRGTFMGHAVEECYQSGGVRPCIEENPSFGVGDVVGCGVNLATRQIIYTINGKRLETTGLYVDSAADLFPCVTLVSPGDEIKANFGPNFKFQIANGI